MKILQPISKEYFESEFLKAEFYKSTFDSVRDEYSKIVFSKNLKSQRYNEIRHILLHMERGEMCQYVSKLKWYLSEVSLEEILFNFHVINAKSWTNVFGANNKKISLICSLIQDGVNDNSHVPKILDIVNAYRDSKQSFFTMYPYKPIILNENVHGISIIEGNHRLVALAYCYYYNINTKLNPLKLQDKVKIIVSGNY